MKQNSTIGFLINRLGLDEDTKKDFIYLYTDGRAQRIRDTTVDEAKQIIQRLMNETGLPESPEVKMRRKILSMAHEMHWEHRDGRVDMDRVNNWCIKYSAYNKPLDELNYLELVTVVSQFEKAYEGFLKGI